MDRSVCTSSWWTCDRSGATGYDRDSNGVSAKRSLLGHMLRLTLFQSGAADVGCIMTIPSGAKNPSMILTNKNIIARVPC